MEKWRKVTFFYCHIYVLFDIFEGALLCRFFSRAGFTLQKKIVDRHFDITSVRLELRSTLMNTLQYRYLKIQHQFVYISRRSISNRIPNLKDWK